jgi:regulator of sigma E protease
MILTILSFLLVLGVLILAHELGHFATAKAFGVKVEEFGIGFPPRLIKFRRGETLYSLNAIPLGGYTKMAGEEDPTQPRSLASKSIGVRLIVLAAGSAMNILLPILLFSIAFMIPHQGLLEPTVVQEVAPDSPAEAAGILPGDTLLGINGQEVNNFSDFQRIVFLNMGREITILVEHADGNREDIRLVPRWTQPEGQGSTGITRNLDIALDNRVYISEHDPFWRAIPKGLAECGESLVMFKNQVLQWIIGTTAPRITGPVGIAQLTGQVARAGISPLIEFAGFISLNLAIMNLLPLPALDGGRIVFVLLEWIRRGKRVSARTEGLVHLIGFGLFIVLMLLVTYQDVIRIITGQSFV